MTSNSGSNSFTTISLSFALISLSSFIFRIYGPMCILTCLKRNRCLPRSTPRFCFALEKCVVCFTSVPSAQRVINIFLKFVFKTCIECGSYCSGVAARKGEVDGGWSEWRLSRARYSPHRRWSVLEKISLCRKVRQAPARADLHRRFVDGQQTTVCSNHFKLSLRQHSA